MQDVRQYFKAVLCTRGPQPLGQGLVFGLGSFGNRQYRKNKTFYIY